MPKGFVYILECSDGTFYTGSTINLEKRIFEHQEGKGSNHTKKRLPLKLVYFEEFQRIDDAFYREKQIQGWSRNKKIALIDKNYKDLSNHAECQNESHYKKWLRLRSATENQLRSATENRLNTTTKNDSSLINKKNKSKIITKPVAERSRSYSNGKLLITGEYVVLDGALSLAIPTTFGQSLILEPIAEPKLVWNSLNDNDGVWFEGKFSFEQIATSSSPRNDNEVEKRLSQILKAAKQLNPLFLNSGSGFKVKTILDFPRDWGLGTSSTLINNIANWANVDAYKLLELSFGGSGYDIACAQHDSAITYQLEGPITDTQNDKKRIIKTVDFNPTFKEQLYFVHLNKKQNSREGIINYNMNKTNLTESILEINSITSEIISCNTLVAFNQLIETHEAIIGSILKQKPVKELLFSDFEGAIKSLGAWGGDFVLVSSRSNPKPYFERKGYNTVIPYVDMVL